MIRLCRTLPIVALACLVFTAGASAQAARFAVLSDPHFYDSELGATGRPMLAVANEDSGTTTLYDIELPWPPLLCHR